jgi:outer membrane protein
MDRRHPGTPWKWIWALLVTMGATRALGAQTPEGTAPPALGPTVTLAEALRLAAERSPQIAQARGSVRTARAGERTVAGSYLPTLSLSSGGTRALNAAADAQSGGPPGSGTPQLPATAARPSNASYNLGLSAGLDVYTGGRRGAERAQARAETESARATLVEQHYAVALETKRAFFAVRRAAELLRVAEKREERAQKALELANQRLRVGSATRSDVLRSQYELTQARQSVLENRNAQRAAAFALGRLVGGDGAVDAAPEAAVDPARLALTREQIVALATEQAPSVVAASANVRAGDAAVGAARAQYLPGVRLTGGYNLLNEDLALWNQNRVRSGSVGVSLSLPILNGFSREESVERARVQVDVAHAQRADAHRAARADVERLLGNLALAEQKIAMAGESVRVAEEDLRVQQDRYRLGASTILDQIQSQQNLVQAETDLVTTRYDYQIARAELEALLGRAL